MPLEKELGKTYGDYYTHFPRGNPVLQHAANAGVARRIYRLVKRSYLQTRFGYELCSGRRASSSLGRLLYLLPSQREKVDLEVRSLHAVREGRLLDLGCGSDAWLTAMQALGWRVEGLDADPRAVRAAAERGLAVRCGSLEQQHFPGETFDAVNLNNVIEHLPDPIRTLKECVRILRPEGTLVVWTPNTASLGHRVLKQQWRGLEPPRHLFLFAPLSLRSLLNRAGFQRISIQARNSRVIWQEGFRLWTHRLGANPGFGARSATNALTFAFRLLEAGLLMVKADAGEWLDAHARKT
jgi:2-polyprenyl-3-methyl-5-hydroxy-6-metoxy-1,4-benzoquinol methylase